MIASVIAVAGAHRTPGTCGVLQSRTARANGLVYINPEMLGLSRVKRGNSFRYRDAKGQWLRDVDELSRIRQLSIPPAYTDVWICPLPNGHLQAPASRATCSQAAKGRRWTAS